MGGSEPGRVWRRNASALQANFVWSMRFSRGLMSQKQAEELLEAHRAGDPDAIRAIHEKHPRFLDSKIPWLPNNLPDSEIRNSAFDLADAQLTIARWYDFRDWLALQEYVEAVTREN